MTLVVTMSSYKVKTPAELYRDFAGMYVEYPMKGKIIMGYLLNEDGTMCFGTFKDGRLEKKMCGQWKPSSQTSFRYIIRAYSGIITGEFSHVDEWTLYSVYEEEWGGKIAKINKDGEFIK